MNQPTDQTPKHKQRLLVATNKITEASREIFKVMDEIGFESDTGMELLSQFHEITKANGKIVQMLVDTYFAPKKLPDGIKVLY